MPGALVSTNGTSRLEGLALSAPINLRGEAGKPPAMCHLFVAARDLNPNIERNVVMTFIVSSSCCVKSVSAAIKNRAA